MKLVSTNPSRNYEKIGEVEISSKKEIEEKVALARKAFPGWKKTPLKERISYLKELIDVFINEAEGLSLLMSREMGMPIRESRIDLKNGIDFLNWYCDNASEFLKPETTYRNKKEIHQVFFEPRGVTAVIVPWNFPFTNFVWQCGQNLLCGNTLIFKHSEETPLFGKALEKSFTSTNFPKGVFNEIYGDGEVGEFLSNQHIDAICFTGSTKVGQILYGIASKKLIPIHMELGGSSPGIIFEDADVDGNLDALLDYKFLNCGQMCKGLKRLIVHKSREDEVISKLKSRLQEKNVGDALDERTDFGPLVAERQVKLLEKQVEDAQIKGAKVVIGGTRPQILKGAYFLPSLLVNIKRDMRVWQEEVFGPVLPIIAFKEESEAVDLANDTKYGLGAYVFTKDKDRFSRVATQLDSGMVSQNSLNFVRACNPFGGYKKSGLGREHGKYGFRELTQTKLVASEKD